ncbi:MAG: YggT family protein [Proteobacteria bacterium]|nr:YggT family protein [Pseudomonadota bacterium]
MQSLIVSTFDVTNALLDLLMGAIIIRALMSWVRPDPSHVLVRTLMRITDPILNPIMRIMPNLGGIDISPIIAILLIQLVQQFLLQQLALNIIGGSY